MTSPLAKIDVSRTEIEQVVAVFYAAIREHPNLGPVFRAHITDWPPHEAKIVRFWANALLGERAYDGNPLQVHRRAGNVRPGMFETWLALFDSVLKAELSPEKAAAWSQIAHRIGRSLRAGMVEKTKGPDGIPLLR